MTVNAHFDGKVIVPDEPLNLPLNQALVVRFELVDPHCPAEGSVLDWLAANTIAEDALPTDLAAEHDRYLYGCVAKDATR